MLETEYSGLFGQYMPDIPVSIVPVDDHGLLIDVSSACAVMTKTESYIYMQILHLKAKG